MSQSDALASAFRRAFSGHVGERLTEDAVRRVREEALAVARLLAPEPAPVDADVAPDPDDPTTLRVRLSVPLDVFEALLGDDPDEPA